MVAALGTISAPAQARDPFIGEIMQFGSNFCPRGWAKANGQLLRISQYSALFALLGTTYGGDGRTTFGLPDLRGRVVIGPGEGPGLSEYRWGQKGGTEKTLETYFPVEKSASDSPDQAQRGGRSSDNRQPFITITTCIALEGIFPSRS